MKSNSPARRAGVCRLLIISLLSIGAVAGLLTFGVSASRNANGPSNSPIASFLQAGLGNSLLSLQDRLKSPNAPEVATTLAAGDIAIVSYTSNNFAANPDKFAFVLLRPIGSATVISFTDQSWNGSAFTASGADSTITFTAGSDLAAGTVVATNNPAFSAMFSGGSLNLDPALDTIFAYQGAAASPTFLYAIEFADANTTFNGSLMNTGLTVGTTAVAVAHENARFVGQSTQIKQTQLAKISDSVQWSGHDGDDIGGTIYDDTSDASISGPLTNPDMQLFVVNNGGGQSDAIVRVDNDETANVGTYLTRLFRDFPIITRLEDISFDVEDGVWFAADNEGTDITRILKGNIADLVSGTSNPTITVVFDYVNNGADPNDDKFIQGIEIDMAANRVFFTLGDISFGHELRSMDYNGGTLRNWGLIDLVIDPTFGFAGGIEDFVIDVPQNTAYFSYVLVNAGAGQVLQNYVVRLTAPLNAAAPNPAVENYAIVNIANAGAPPPGYPAGRIPDAEGSIRGMDYDAATNTIWFMTGRLGAGGTGGIFTLNLNTLNYTEVWQQPSNNAHNTPQPFPTTLLVDIEVDSIGGRYYVTSLNSTDTPMAHDGTATDENGSRIWSGSLTSAIGTAPTFFASVFENTANGAGAGMEINYAPTLSVTDAGSTYTEAAGNPSPLAPSVAVISASTVFDADQTIIKGATVAITTGYINSVDTLTFTNSGGITGTWTAATGVLSFTGNATFAQYQTVLNSVRFTASGDNPTAYGTNFLRTFSFSVTDGLAWSDLGTSTVDVVGVNDAPVNAFPGAQSVNEDTNLSILSLSVSDVDADPASQQLTTTLSVVNGTLTVLAAGGAGVSGSGTATVTLTGTRNQINITLGAVNNVVYRGLQDYFGPDTLTYTTNDQGNTGTDPGLTGTATTEQDQDLIGITVNPVNDAPTASADALSSIAEDSGQRTIPFADLTGNDSTGPANENTQTLIVKTVTSPIGGTVLISGGNVLFTPTADYNGPASFQYTVEDNGQSGNPLVNDFKVSAPAVTVSFTITEVNDAPTASADPLSSVAEDSGQRTITIASLLGNDLKGPANEVAQTLMLTGVSSPVGGTVSHDVTNVYFTPAADFNGPASFQYTITDDGTTNGGADPLTNTGTVSFSITAVNDAPALNAGATPVLNAVNEDAGAPSGAVGTLVSSLVDLAGGGGLDNVTEVDSTLVTGIAVTGADITNGTWLYTINGGTNWFALGAVTDDAARFLAADAGTRIYFQPSLNFNGAVASAITFRAWDQTSGSNGATGDPSPGGTTTAFSTDSDTADITVDAVNDAPSFTKGPNDGVPINFGARTLNNWATNIVKGPADETGQVLTFNITNNTNTALFAVQPSVDPSNGTLTYTTANDATGSATLTLTLSDDGSSTAPNANTSSPETFVISVGPTASGGTVTGRIVDSGGAPVEGAVVRLSGAQNRKFITDANGVYRFEHVETGGFYNVTPTRVNYTFSPSVISFSQLGETTEAAFGATATGGSANPLDTPEYFVRQNYLDFLGREPDEAGFNFWSDQILSCGENPGDTDCVDRKRTHVSAAYFFSIEFQETGGLVDGLYRASFGSRPNFAEFRPDAAAVAPTLVVGSDGWATTLENGKAAFVDAFVQRAAFRTVYAGLSSSDFVDALIANTGVVFTSAERNVLVSGLEGGTMTRAAALRAIVQDADVVAAKRNEAFVMMEYFGYLRREPDAGGYDFWLNKLIQFNGNFEQAEMVKAFIVSGEYRDRFPR